MSTVLHDDPALWEAVKAEMKAGDKGGKPGEWSARKAQMSVLEYKRRGGGYVSPKPQNSPLQRWQKRQDKDIR